MIILGLPTPFRRTTAWHLASTESRDELVGFADGIGLPRTWLQEAGSHPHYDVWGRYYPLAVRAGARPVDRREYIKSVYRGESNATFGDSK